MSGDGSKTPDRYDLSIPEQLGGLIICSTCMYHVSATFTDLASAKHV